MPDVVKGLESSTRGTQLNSRLLVEHAARSHRDQSVVTDNGSKETVTNYSELMTNINKIGNVTQTLEISPGEVVGLYGHSNTRFMELLYGISNVGAAPFTINLELPTEHQRHCLKHVRENAPFEKIFVHEELLGKLRTVLPEGTDFKLVTMGESAGGSPDSSTVSYQLHGLMDSASSEFDWPQVDESSTAYLMFTSGTTGKPKAVAHSHKMVWHNSLGIAAAKNLGPQDNILMVPPLFHLGWMLWGVAPVVGADLILPGKGYPDNLLDLIVERDVTFSTGIPTLFKRVVDTVKKRRSNGEDISLEDLEVVFGGQAPPTELIRDLEELGGTASQLYGYTEGGTNFSFSIQNDLRPRERALADEELLQYKSEVSGYFVPGIEARLVDPETGDELAWDGDSQGELYSRSPWSAEYWEMPEENRSSMTQDGYLKTGDIVSLDEYGNIYFRDRRKEIIKSGGEWVSATLLEDYITRHPGVSDCAVIAAEHDKWMERPVAIVTLEKSTTDEDLALSDYLGRYVETGDIEKWWIPDAFVVVEALPETSVGKYDKKKLKEEYGSMLLD